MASRTIRRELSRRVVRVGRLVVIGCVTARAGVRGIGIIAVVTGVAIIGNGGVRTVQRVKTVVVEGRRRPG